jgi:hypothetical protein
MVSFENRGGSSMSQYNRRTIVRGAAWTIPVVAVASTAPAFAASNEAPRPTAVSTCKETAGSKCYRFVLSFPVATEAWNLTLTSVVVTNSTVPDGEELIALSTPKNFTVSAASGANNVWTIKACTTGNLASSAAVKFVYTATSTSGLSESVTLTYNYPSIDPCDK